MLRYWQFRVNTNLKTIAFNIILHVDDKEYLNNRMLAEEKNDDDDDDEDLIKKKRKIRMEAKSSKKAKLDAANYLAEEILVRSCRNCKEIASKLKLLMKKRSNWLLAKVLRHRLLTNIACI